jgi:hypothetical protein
MRRLSAVSMLNFCSLNFSSLNSSKSVLLQFRNPNAAPSDVSPYVPVSVGKCMLTIGLRAIPRRYSDYPDAYTGWNVVSTVGSTISFLGVIIFVYIIWEAYVSQRLVFRPYNMPTSILSNYNKVV